MKLSLTRTMAQLGLIAILALPCARGADPTYSREELSALLRFSAQSSGKPQQDWGMFIDRYYQNPPPNRRFSQREAQAIVSDMGVGLNLPDAALSGTGVKATRKPDPLWGIKIRQDYNDVVSSEDLTVDDPKERRNQLAGAAFSYSRNYLGDFDTWSARGAIIRPFELYNIENQPDGGGYSSTDPALVLRAAYLIPSVSLHKVTTESPDPKDEVDSLIYRMGIGGRWGGVSEDLMSEVEFRCFATWATDTSHEASTVAAEFDIEPRFAGIGEDARWALGFQGSLDGRVPTDPKQLGDNSNFLYHLRGYLHGEFGEIHDAGDDPTIREGDFFRFGPVIKLEMQPCGLARALNKNPLGIKVHASYSYLPTLDGNDSGRDYLFSAGIDWAILEREAQDQSVSLKLLYEKGGVDLTKKEVEALTLGLGVTF